MDIDLDDPQALTTAPPPLALARQRHAEAVEAEQAAQTAFQAAKARRTALTQRLQSVRYQLRLASNDQSADTFVREARDVEALLTALAAELTVLHTKRAALSQTLVTAHHTLLAVQGEASRAWHRARASQIEEAQATHPWERLEAREAAAKSLEELASLIGQDEAQTLQDGHRPAWRAR